MLLNKQVMIRANRAAVAAQLPSYLVDMPDPSKSSTMQMLSFYRFFDTPKASEDELEVGGGQSLKDHCLARFVMDS